MSSDPAEDIAVGHTRTELEARASASLTEEGMIEGAMQIEIDRRLDMCLIDASQLKRLCPGANLGILTSLARAMTAYFPEFDIMTNLRICHFMAQTAHESGGFSSLTERPSHYDSSKSKYKGRGIMQLTGKRNYRYYGKLVQVPLVEYPELAAMPQLSVLIACHYWDEGHLNRAADRDDVKAITRSINGTKMLGLAERKTYLARAKTIWPPAIKTKGDSVS